jgi:hypothetical protein
VDRSLPGQATGEDRAAPDGPASDEELLLRRLLQRIVHENLGDAGTSIVGIDRKRCPFIGSYECDIVRVKLGNGRALELFLKDFGHSQKSKDDPGMRRERELSVYRDVLAGTDLGTPKFYGSLWDDSVSRYWLVLEYVDGVIVQDRGIEHGTLAAAWLGRMHGYFARNPEPLSGCDLLTRHDAAYFSSKAEQALHDTAQISPASARKLEAVVREYEPITALLAAQPITLVHGGYIPWHIVIDADRDPVRVCPVDWELAALGGRLYDLAFFVDGAEPDARAAMLDAYRESATESGVPVPDGKEMEWIVDGLRLHRVFDWLSRGVEKDYSAAKVAKLVDRAEGQIALLRARS